MRCACPFYGDLMPQAQAGAPRRVCARCGFTCSRCLGRGERPMVFDKP